MLPNNVTSSLSVCELGEGQTHKHSDHSITLAFLSILALLLSISLKMTLKKNIYIYINVAYTIGYRISIKTIIL